MDTVVKWEKFYAYGSGCTQKLFLCETMVDRGRRFAIVQHKPLIVSGQKKEAGWVYLSNQISDVHGKSKSDLVTNGPLCCTIAKRHLPTMWYCNAFMLMRKVEQFIKFKILQYYVKTAQM